MQKKLLLFLFLILNLSVTAQDKRFTHNAENGYMWIDFEKRIIGRDLKYEYLGSLLEKQKVINSYQFKSDSLGCRNDIKFLFESGKADKIDLSDMVKRIDEFYKTKDYLIIPIMYAYCYCIKEIAGRSGYELNKYITKLLQFSSNDLKQ
jgi:hypothetical protein